MERTSFEKTMAVGERSEVDKEEAKIYLRYFIELSQLYDELTLWIEGDARKLGDVVRSIEYAGRKRISELADRNVRERIAAMKSGIETMLAQLDNAIGRLLSVESLQILFRNKLGVSINSYEESINMVQKLIEP